MMKTTETATDGSTRVNAPALCSMAAKGLVQMFNTGRNLFCYRLNRTSRGMVQEGLSYRYTLMSLLGLHQYESRTGESSPIPVGQLTGLLLDQPALIRNLSDLGLLLWLCALATPERLDESYKRLRIAAALDQFRSVREGRTMDLALFLSGLAHAYLVHGEDLSGIAATADKTRSLLVLNQGAEGIFGHSSPRQSWAGSLRGNIGSFADQVYPIFALAKFGDAFQDRVALNNARLCAQSICAAQGQQGQWWWHYDNSTGKVLQRYPVYSVHQHGMAPMALLALAESTGLEFTHFIRKGLAWIGGDNELRFDLRCAQSSLIWRSLCPPNRSRVYLKEFIDRARLSASFADATPSESRVGRCKMSIKEFLNAACTNPYSIGNPWIRHECRPYELGWLLYALSGRDHSG